MNLLITTSSFNCENNPHIEALIKAGHKITINPHGRKLTEAEVTGLLANDVVGMIAGVEPLTANVLKTAPNLRVIVRLGAGMDSVDLTSAEECGIKVYSTPDGPTAAVSELTIGLMLDVLRDISLSAQRLNSGTWQTHTGRLLRDKIVGIIGFGRIGQEVARLSRALGAKVVYFDPFPQESELGESLSLEALLEKADIVSLHVPLLESTKNLITRTELSKMKRDSILINTSRGGIVDESALQTALMDGWISGAAIDVFSEEPYSGPLLGMENVVCTPHSGSRAKEARIKMEQDAARLLASEIEILNNG